MAVEISRSLVESLEDRSWRAWKDPTRMRLHGPHRNSDSMMVDSILEFIERTRRGENIEYLREVAQSQAGDSATNLVVPVVAFMAKAGSAYICDVFVVSHPEDAMRLAAAHVKKSVLYAQSFLGDGVLTTTDTDSWRKQRSHLVTAFLPSSLKREVFPTSYTRAQYACFSRMPKLLEQGSLVDLSEFFLHEAMAQLHLSLFGEEEAFSERSNCPLRRGFSVLLEGPLSHSRSEIVESYKNVREFSRDVLLHQSEHPQGPLGKLLVSNPVQQSVREDTVTTCSFAGFDTTANLMQWFVFSALTADPSYLARLLVEVDDLFDQGAPLSFEGIRSKPFFNRCIAETLRLFPSVPNGTFRELGYDDSIQGVDGTSVRLPAGAQIMIPSYLLHRSTRLWGNDADKWNPDRRFSDAELMSSFQGTFSERYCPFTFPPRSCLGMNFAHMEARVILAHMFRHYHFELAEPMLSLAKSGAFMGENFGTMMPKGGLHCHVTRRTPSPKL